MKKPPRIFKEINVGHFVVQSTLARYPDRDGANGLLPPPQYAPWRLNLVALSQRYNLYFAAYKDKVHITIPRDLRQTLPGRADLILNLPRSKEGIAVGGFIDETFPHSVNHLKLGKLGDFEILLMACDDGDVIAYYTHLLWKETILGSNYTEAPTAETQPFFHENVGKTAWGLAIHEKSRLIAVSSNLREVTVFCFGSSSAADITRLELLEEEAMSRTEMFPLSTGLSSMAQISYSQNYRIKLRVGPGSHNIPAIDFVSGDCGEAELVLATDINGNLWFLNIWSGERTCETRMHQQLSELESMGWGVLSLPLSYFKVEHTPQEAFGMSDLEKALVNNTNRALSTQHLDISLSIPDVSEASIYHPMLGLGMGGLGTIVQDDVKDRPASLELVPMDDNRRSDAQYVMPKDQNTFAWDPKAVAFQRLVNTPLADRLAKLMHAREFTEKHADEFDFDYIPHAQRDGENRKFILPDRSAILRTFNHDVQLLPPCPGSMFPTVCRGVVRQRFGNLPVDIQMDRLNMLAAIPELSLVVVGSQIGRAALFSLTKLPDGYSKYGPVVTFRLDLILPLKKHEDAWDPKPNMHLLGIAVAPLQTTTGDETKEGEWPKRWRLILHYVNHTILSYELWRDNKDTLIVT